MTLTSHLLNSAGMYDCISALHTM